MTSPVPAAVLQYASPADGGDGGDADVTRAILWGGVAYGASCMMCFACGPFLSARSWATIPLALATSLITLLTLLLLIVSATALRRSASLEAARHGLPVLAVLLAVGWGAHLAYSFGADRSIRTAWPSVVSAEATFILWPVTMAWCMGRQRRVAGRPLRELLWWTIVLGVLVTVRRGWWIVLDWRGLFELFGQSGESPVSRISGITGFIAGPMVVAGALLSIRSPHHRRLLLTICAPVLVVPSLLPHVQPALFSGGSWNRLNLMQQCFAVIASTMNLLAAMLASWTRRYKPG